MWTLSDHAQREIIDEIEAELKKEGDRSVALIAGAFLEQRLEEAIKALLVKNTHVENQMFKGKGPLATFSAKIDIGLLLGLYEERTAKVLHNVRKVRNEFAHKLGRATFETQNIRALCNNFAPVRENTFKVQTGITGTPKTRRRLSQSEFKKFEKMIFGAMFNVADTPRNRFIATVKALLLMLKLIAYFAEKRTKDHPLPFSSSHGKVASRTRQRIRSDNRTRNKPTSQSQSSRA